MSAQGLTPTRVESSLRALHAQALTIGFARRATAYKRADLIFRAVQIRAGTHVVEFYYAPDSFRVGMLVSAGALILLAGLWLSHTLLSRPLHL